MGSTRRKTVLFAMMTVGLALAFAPAARVAKAAGAAKAAGGARAVGDASAVGAAVTMLGVPGRANATPWVAADGRFVAIAWGASSGEKKSDLFVAISRDGGDTFAAPVQVNVEAGEGRLGGELPPRVVLLPPSPRATAGATGAAGASRVAGTGGAAGAEPDVAVLWTARGATTSIKIARSRDGGRRFDAPVSLQTVGAPGDRGWPALAADRRGTLHAIWLDHRGLAAMKSGQPHAAGHHTAASGTRSDAPAAGGAASGTAAVTAADPAMHDSVAMAQRSGLYYASVGMSPSRSQAPASSSASPEREVTPGVCYCCKTALAVRGDGAIVAAWRQVYAGNIRDIAFTISRDGGQTFAAPRRVSEDRWEINGCPDDGPAIAVGPDDTTHLVWPTVILKGDEPEGALFYASTRDGRTFTPRQRIPTLGSPKPMHPQLLVDAAGRITIAWDEFLDGQRVAAMRTMTSKPGTSGELEPGRVVTLGSGDPGGANGSTHANGSTRTNGASAADAPAQYPMLAETRNGAIAVWTSGASSASTIAVRRLPSAPAAASALLR